MPRKGINVCRKCKRWGCKASINDKDEIIATCPHCGHSWKSTSRYVRRYLERTKPVTGAGRGDNNQTQD